MKRIMLSGAVIVLFGAYTFLIRSADLSYGLVKYRPTPIELVTPTKNEVDTNNPQTTNTTNEQITKNIDCVYVPYDKEVEESYSDNEEEEKEQKGYYKCTTIIVTPTKTTTTTPKPTKTTTQPTTTASAPKTTSTSIWKNGTFIGNSIDAYYGNVRVSATISGGKLTNVTFLDYPRDRQTSLQKSNRAMPILKSEAIAKQSAKVNTVSGATYTSKAFIKSLSSALTQATI